MTDRELLELAAKAAEIECEIEEFSGGRCLGTNQHNEIVFDPLTDDGDAFRLAVHLRMMIDFIKDGVWFERYKQNHVVAVGDEESHYELIETDPYAATRRAITRAAAEIGRTTT